MKRITVDQVMARHPCDAYPRSRVADLWKGAEALTAAEILRLDIDWSDRLWAVRMTKALPNRVWQLWVIDCATRVLPIFENKRPGDTRVRDCLKAAVDYLDGRITIDALREARAAAAAAAAAADADAAAYAAYADAAAHTELASKIPGAFTR